ncbi:MAG: carbohydrate-binding protein [Myxococcota bacterium]|nr:carbohydrate-binding protein [Myxococcota bacterium]
MRKIRRANARILTTLSLMVLMFGSSGCGYTFALKTSTDSADSTQTESNLETTTDSDTHTSTGNGTDSDSDTHTSTGNGTDSDTDTVCGTIDCVDNCDPEPCVNGTCFDGVDSYSCVCEEGWMGPNCDRDEPVAVYEAEDCTAQGDAGFSNKFPGYLGTGYMDYGGAGAWIEWNNVNLPEAGTYTLKFRYSSSIYGRPCTLFINGVDSGQIPFKGVPGATWSDWTTSTITLALSGGTMTIRVTSVDWGPNLDRMTIE